MAPPLRLEVVVEVEARSLVPEVGVDAAVARRGPRLPGLRRAGVPQHARDLRPVLLHLVEEHVQADGRVMDDVHAEGAEPVRGVEARLAHGAVALVEEVGQAVRLAVVIARDVVVRDLVGLVVLAHAVVVAAPRGVPLVGFDLGRGALAAVVIAGEADPGDEVRLGGPEPVVLLHRGQRRAQPLAVLVLLVDAQEHPGQEGRLGPRQVIRAVGVEQRAVVLDLVAEVGRHVARRVHLAVAQQADLDEVAVPPVHLVEAAAGDHVGMRQVEQPVLADGRGIGRERAQVDGGEIGGRELAFEVGLDAGAVLAWREVHGPRRPRRQVQLGVARGRGQVAQRPAQRGPALLDVLADGGQSGGGRQIRFRSARRAQRPGRRGQQDGEQDGPPPPTAAAHRFWGWRESDSMNFARRARSGAVISEKATPIS